MRPHPHAGLCGAEGQTLGPASSGSAGGATSLLDLACPCFSHDKGVICKETCLVLDSIRVTLP